MESKHYKAIAKFLPYSPYKLRPIADVIRGKNAEYALHWLEIYRNRRTVPIKKTLLSALANATDLKCNASHSQMVVKEIRIDQGPVRKYFKPGAQGRATILRRRYSHVTVVVEPKKIKNEVAHGTKG